MGIATAIFCISLMGMVLAAYGLGGYGLSFTQGAWLTAAGLGVVGVSLASLKQKLSATTTFINAGLWALLAIRPPL